MYSNFKRFWQQISYTHLCTKRHTNIVLKSSNDRQCDNAYTAVTAVTSMQVSLHNNMI